MSRPVSKAGLEDTRTIFAPAAKFQTEGNLLPLLLYRDQVPTVTILPVTFTVALAATSAQ